MSDKDKKRWQLGKLFSLARDLELDESQSEELQELLSSDPDLRRHYVELIATESNLEKLHSRPLLDDTSLPGVPSVSATDSSKASAPAVRRDVKVVELPPEEYFKAGDRLLSSYAFRWLFATAALLLVGYFGWAYLGFSEGFATVVSVDNGGKEDSHFSVGERIGTDWVSFESGVAHLSFQSSAMVAVHGPAELRALGPNRVELRSGSLSVHVPEAATGFTVVTERIDVEDLGTNFSINLNPEHDLSVHVTEGVVRVRDKSSNQIKRVSEGQLANTNLSDSEGSHIQVLDSSKVAPKVSGGFRFLKKHPTSLGYDAFDHNNRAFVFLESSRRRLPFDLSVNLAEPGEYTHFSGTAATIAEGTIVDCYLIHSAPKSASHEVRGGVKFPGEIVGVICDHDRLNATNEVLGAKWTLRCNYVHRGLEMVPLESTDWLKISKDRRSITAILRNSAIDQFRVLVRAR